MESRLTDAREAASHVLAGSRAGRAAVTFDAELIQVAPFSGLKTLPAAMATVVPFGETSSAMRSQAALNTSGIAKDRALVVLTDGRDTSSRLTAA
jgi:hypothetical protein